MQIRITSDFSGYPDGRTERVFRTGEQPDDLDDDYADLLVRKELAEPIAASAKAAEPKPSEAPPARPGFLPPQNPAPKSEPAPAGEKKDIDA